MKRFFILAIAVVVLAVTPVVALADGGPADGEPVEVPQLVEVLALLAEGLGAGTIAAFLFEKMGWFQNLPKDAKWWVVLIISVGLPLAARVLLEQVPADVWDQIEPYWHALAAGFLTWAGSQAAHKLDTVAQKMVASGYRTIIGDN